MVLNYLSVIVCDFSLSQAFIRSQSWAVNKWQTSAKKGSISPKIGQLCIYFLSIFCLLKVD